MVINIEKELDIKDFTSYVIDDIYERLYTYLNLEDNFKISDKEFEQILKAIIEELKGVNK